MSYSETINYLFTRLPMYSRIGAAAYKEDLDNTLALCAALDNPERKFRSIHIAGTNGKGSVSHMLAAVLQTAGYKTGLYTSPHLRDFRERIRINGEMVPEAVVVSFTERIRPEIDRIEPSFFEITVAMAFDYFAQEQVDIAVIETGLGGRLDSTNVIVPELSIITNIGWDHMNLLGDTLEKIAGEKAGIIKPGVPAVIGEVIPETRSVFEQASARMQAPLVWAEEKREVLNVNWEQEELVVSLREKGKEDPSVFSLDLSGIYQAKNLCTVLAACDLLQERGWIKKETAIREGLRHAKKLTGLHGRWEWIRRKPGLVLDVAHNVNGIAQLLEQIRHTPHRQLHLVLGMVKDKDIREILRLLPTDAHYYFTRSQIPRALPETELQEAAAVLGLQGDHYPDVNKAIQAAARKAGKEDLIVVCGSIFLAGEVSLAGLRACWEKEADYNWLGDALDALGFSH